LIESKGKSMSTLVPEITTPAVGTFTSGAPTINDLILTQLAPVAVQAVEGAVQDANASLRADMASSQAAVSDTVQALHAESKSLIGDLAARLTAIEPKVEQALGRVGVAVVHNAETDPVTQRGLVWGVGAAVVLYAGVVLVAYLLGNPQAAKLWGTGLGAIGAYVLWVSNAGTALPKLPTKSK
jgi:hypothetical protein